MSTIKTERCGKVGLITLNRPRALNALTLDMVEAMHVTLDDFEADERITVVVLRSGLPGVFCAGGDVRHVRELSLAGRHGEAMRFFEREFALNLRIARFGKPYLAVIDGICFGGGLGLSVHGSFRIVGPSAVLAMPETAIGYIPDVGSSYFLSRLPPGVDLWLGLTGARVRSEHALELGLATHGLAPAQFDDLIAQLAAGDEVEASLAALGATPASGHPEATIDRMARHFGQTDLPSIFRSLEGDQDPAAAQALSALHAASPRSLHLAFDLIRQGRQSSLEACLDRELAAAEQTIQHPDFAEGVRALLVDKDRTPRWQSGRLADHSPGRGGAGEPSTFNHS